MSPPAPFIHLNGARFRPGETARVGFEVRDPTFGTAADLYLGVMLPDGHTMVSLTRAGGFGAVADRAAPRSLRPTEPAPPGFSANHPAFLVYTFPAVGPHAGTYGIFAALVRQGAFIDNRIDAADVLAIDVKTLEYQP